MKKKVVIVGAGFGGLKLAKALGKYPEQVDVTIIDKRNHHLFQPLLYQVATAGLSPADIASPIRGILSEYHNTQVFMDEIINVDLSNKKIESALSTYHYDFLVLACGASHSYFGKDEWEEFAPGLKTLEHATEIRRRILTAFEKAEKEKDEQIKESYLTFVIVGAGPTGVEMAGAIAEIAKQTLEHDFRNIDPKKTKVYLIEGQKRVLAQFNEILSEYADADLKHLEVEIINEALVTEINRDGVVYKKNDITSSIKAKTVVWAAGVKPAKINATLGVELDRAGRIIVNDDLTVAHHKNVFVIGDQANFKTKDGHVLPGLAPVAMQMGRHVAKNILAQIEQANMSGFKYLDKGQMATIGRNKAVMEYKDLKARGRFAWMSWLFVHIYYLIGFKNRFTVMFQWIWSYMTFSRGARLITNEKWKDS